LPVAGQVSGQSAANQGRHLAAADGSTGNAIPIRSTLSGSTDGIGRASGGREPAGVERMTPDPDSFLRVQTAAPSLAASTTTPGTSESGGKTPIRRSGDEQPGNVPREVTTGRSLWTTVGGLALIVVVVLGLGPLGKKLARGRGEVLPEDVVQVLGNRRLDATSTLHVVRIGQRVLAIGASAAGLRTLAEIDDPSEVQQLMVRTAGGRSRAAEPFRSHFASEPGSREAPAADPQSLPTPAPAAASTKLRGRAIGPRAETRHG
jgi:flagellar biogenesis protein FliO